MQRGRDSGWPPGAAGGPGIGDPGEARDEDRPPPGTTSATPRRHERGLLRSCKNLFQSGPSSPTPRRWHAAMTPRRRTRQPRRRPPGAPRATVRCQVEQIVRLQKDRVVDMDRCRRRQVPLVWCLARSPLLCAVHARAGIRLTTQRGGWARRTRCTLPKTRTTSSTSVLSDPPAKCGVRITLSSVRKGWPAGSGSSRKTSRAAPRTDYVARFDSLPDGGWGERGCGPGASATRPGGDYVGRS